MLQAVSIRARWTSVDEPMLRPETREHQGIARHMVYVPFADLGRDTAGIGEGVFCNLPVMNPGNVVGQDASHLCSPADAELLSVSVHRDVVEPFRDLHAAAANEGFDVSILSGFRSFEKQLSI